MNVSIPPDDGGYTGRECPECESYFKIIFGTGLEDATECVCPYCGHSATHNHFWTKAQIEYAKSVALNHFTGKMHKSLKKIERKHRPKRGALSISFKVTGRPTPISHYYEEQLETEIECSNCTLKYAVYGVFAFCPDCARHNSQQILDKNLELVGKMLDLATEVEDAMSQLLIEDALENVVSSFDGFGREVCIVFANKVSAHTKAAEIRFQNLTLAQTKVKSYFGFDIASQVTPNEWEIAGRCFQKRHLLAHKSSVIDTDYIKKANDPSAVEGRKIKITIDEVSDLIVIIRKIGTYILSEMRNLP